MRAVLQRVHRASVRVGGAVVGEITEPGLVALVGVTHTDGMDQASWLARKIADLRILRQERSVRDVGAPVLLVSQFTLYADLGKGRRPSWSVAAPAGIAEPLIDAVGDVLRELGIQVATGVFGAEMTVEIIGDGPVTILLETPQGQA